MDHSFASSASCRSAPWVIVATIGIAAGSLVGGAYGQTLVNSTPHRESAPSLPKQSRPAAKNNCAQYGAGFAPMPGTTMCIKIGGYIEGSVGFRR